MISGGSAGGYTTLAALVFHDVFCGGASYYGVSDIAALARDQTTAGTPEREAAQQEYDAAMAAYKDIANRLR